MVYVAVGGFVESGGMDLTLIGVRSTHEECVQLVEEHIRQQYTNPQIERNGDVWVIEDLDLEFPEEIHILSE